jgi:hypothetical protein
VKIENMTPAKFLQRIHNRNDCSQGQKTLGEPASDEPRSSRDKNSFPSVEILGSV